jgi:hypothetical protein
MSKVCYISELLILCFSDIELFSSGFLSDLLDTLGPPTKHTPFLHHDQSNFDYGCACLTDHELLYFYALIHAVRLIIQMFMDGLLVGLRLLELCILITPLWAVMSCR